MKRRTAIVVGASSGIGAQLARDLAKDGYDVALVARRSNELEALAVELRGLEARAVVAVHDVTHDDPQVTFNELCDELGGLDALIYAAGVMPTVESDEFNTSKSRIMFEVNTLGAVAWLNAGASYFQEKGAGSLVAISSVAGDRGRRLNPAYAASKAAITTFMESLRNRLTVRGVHVLTVKPGPVRTPMTEGMDDLPFIVGPEVVSRSIVRGIRRRSQTVYVPGRWRPIMWVIRTIPSFLFRRMNV